MIYHLIKKSNNWQGALWKIYSCLCFSIVNGIVRFLTGGVEIEEGPPPLSFTQIAFFQNIIGSCILLPWIIKTKKISLITSMPNLHLLRIIFAVCGLILWYASLRYMPITYALALSFTSPIITIIVCRIFLKESLSNIRLLSIILSFIGAILITQSNIIFNKNEITNNIHQYYIGWYFILPITATFCWVISKILSSQIAKNGDSPELMTLYLLTFMSPISLIPALITWEPIEIIHLTWCTIIAIISTIAHLCMAKALSLAEITFLTPFGCARFLLSGIIGYICFNELPYNIEIWTGILLIILSIIILSLESKKITKYTKNF